MHAIAVAPVLRLPYARDIYDYTSTEELLEPGSIVIVTLRGNRVQGVVLGAAEGKFTMSRLLPITDIERGFCIPTSILTFLTWMRSRYGVSYGVLFASLFSFLPRNLGDQHAVVASGPRSDDTDKIFWNQITSVHGSITFIEQRVQEYPQSQVLVLFPNSILLEQAVVAAAALHPSIVHSGVAKRKLVEIGSVVANGGPALIFATRVGLFLPWMKLAALVLAYENHEDYGALESAPRYHTRDVAIELARATGVPLYALGSIPSLVFWSNFKASVNFQLQTSLVSRDPGQRDNFKSPTIIDMRDRPYDQRFFSYECLENILETLRKKQSVLLIHERRGAITTLRCRSCASLLRCADCGSAVLSKGKITLCPECKSDQPSSPTCAQCAASIFLRDSAGIERIKPELEQLLKKEFPERAPEVHVWSKDFQLRPSPINLPAVVLATSYAFDRMKMLTERRPAFGLVVVLSIDRMFGRGDFDGAEQAFHRMTQFAFDAVASGLHAMIQTKFADHHVFKALSAQDPKIFYEQEEKERVRFGFPPAFARMTIQPRLPVPSLRRFIDRLLNRQEVIATKSAIILRCPTPERNRLIEIQSALLDRFVGKLKITQL